MTNARIFRLENEEPTMALEVDCSAVAGIDIRIKVSDAPYVTATLQYTLFSDEVDELVETLQAFQERLKAFRTEKSQ